MLLYWMISPVIQFY